jgi:hypothetical protein
MQKAISQKTAWTVILILLLVICFCFLSKMGIQPLWAAIGVVFIKAFVRFIFRITVVLVSIAIVISLFTFLICI